MFRTISIPELKTAFEKLGKDEIIVDIRTPEEFSTGHVPNSINIPHEEIEALKKAVEGKKTAYLYCRSGGRVGFSCGELSGRGVKNIVGVIGGGMPNWIAQGYPVE